MPSTGLIQTMAGSVMGSELDGLIESEEQRIQREATELLIGLTLGRAVVAAVGRALTPPVVEATTEVGGTRDGVNAHDTDSNKQ